jgi:DNA (cytosine-5)-methyltransferase 1
MRFLSLFSGIEAASVAWLPLGWTCVGVAEIEPFPAALLAHHYPDVPNLGNVKEITAEGIQSLGHIDLVVFGFPCQDLSVAGKRAGLKGERSGLFYDAMRIVRWSRARWAVAENVPGLFSSHRGRDFAAVVGEMAGCEFDVPTDGWKSCGAAAGKDGLVEWSVLDAQFWGVAQRRRRVFLVRDAGDWSGRPPVLFERESLCGHPAPSREAREGIANSLTERPDRGGGNSEGQRLITHCLRADGFDASEDGTGGGIPLVTGPMTRRGNESGSYGEKLDSNLLIPVQDELSRCLNAGGMGRQDWETETLVIHEQ